MSEPRDAARVKVFPPVVPLATILLGVGLGRWWPIDVGLEPSAALRNWAGGLVLAAAVLFLGLWSLLLVRASGQSENPWKPTTRVIERGPYRVSRNPMYLQLVLICVGFAVLLWNLWILLLTPLAVWSLQRLAIAPEEAYLEAKFGETYRAYKRRVRRWL